MLGAEDRAVGVVVEDGELGAPEENDLGLDGSSMPTVLRRSGGPLVDGAEWRLRPVHGAHARTHLAAADEEGAADPGCLASQQLQARLS
jgi:hypothetical protein